jgi:hypothetical protein
MSFAPQFTDAPTCTSLAGQLASYWRLPSNQRKSTLGLKDFEFRCGTLVNHDYPLRLKPIKHPARLNSHFFKQYRHATGNRACGNAMSIAGLSGFQGSCRNTNYYWRS